jgi:hypothetical protein
VTFQPGGKIFLVKQRLVNTCCQGSKILLVAPSRSAQEKTSAIIGKPNLAVRYFVHIKIRCYCMHLCSTARGFMLVCPFAKYTFLSPKGCWGSLYILTQFDLWVKYVLCSSLGALLLGERNMPRAEKGRKSMELGSGGNGASTEERKVSNCKGCQ